MERKTVDTLHAMFCGELEEIAKKGILSHETLDIVKDLLESEKNLMKIEKYEKEIGEERGYSQRKYYIDADYNPQHMNSYRGMYDGGNSYGRSYNSYMTYPNWDMRYSRTGSKMEIVEALKEMMKEATDENIKKAISEAITKLEK